MAEQEPVQRHLAEVLSRLRLGVSVFRHSSDGYTLVWANRAFTNGLPPSRRERVVPGVELARLVPPTACAHIAETLDQARRNGTAFAPTVTVRAEESGTNRIFRWCAIAHEDRSNVTLLMVEDTDGVAGRAASIEAGRRERAALAHRLHDGPLQTLSELTLLMNAAERESEELDLAAANALAAQVASECRALMVDLRDDIVTDDLVEGLEQLIGRHAALGVGQASLRVYTKPAWPPNIVRDALKVAAEALHNSAKHAPGSRVSVSVGREGTTVRIEVRDDGPGFSAERAEEAPSNGHIGLDLAHERARKIGGSLRVESAPGRGCRIALVIPDDAVAER